ncbi:MAG: hypothetical protein U0638_02955 [Phycisphaerales bacterium]
MGTLGTQPIFTLAAAPTGRSFAITHDGGVWGAIVDSDIATDPSSPALRGELAKLGATRIVVAHARPGHEGDRPALAWTRASVEALHGACQRWLGAVAPGATLLLWPRADQLISDIPSAWSLLRTLETERLGLLLDPDAMITESMRVHRADHLQRFADSLASEPRTALLIDRGGLPGDYAPQLPRLRQPEISHAAHGT